MVMWDKGHPPFNAKSLRYTYPTPSLFEPIFLGKKHIFLTIKPINTNIYAKMITNYGLPFHHVISNTHSVPFRHLRIPVPYLSVISEYP